MGIVNRITNQVVKRIPLPDSVEHTLDAALDRAISVQRPVIRAHVGRVRRAHPDETPAQVIGRLEKHYLVAVAGIGGASGAAAAVPGVGTAASLASGAAEVGAFVSATAMYALALAEIHGLPMDDPQVRRALVLAVLVGDDATKAIAGAGATHWAEVLAKSGSQDRLAGINGRLASMLLRRVGARQGALAFGRALPLGIGAVIGAGGNVALARGVVRSARKAFGRTPARFAGRVVDA